MPEMPEVTTVVRSLQPKIVGSKILKVLIYKEKLIKDINAEDFKLSIENRQIKNIFNVGKHIIIALEGDIFILNHLRMSGKYSFYQKWHEPTLHDHVVFELSNGFLYFNDARAFATFHLKSADKLYSTSPLNKLGKVPFETDIDWLYKKIAKKSSPIKNILLDQSLVLGIGNIYANESLFECSLHPNTPANFLTKNQLNNLIQTAGKIMDIATQMGGSSIQSYSSLNGQKGSYQNLLKVHGKNGQKCLKCSDSIQKIWVGGRGSYFCPSCQQETK
ncbi:formamidopyrimidine-DNA glycosylase [Mycoplasmopsis californica]|uniref:Formamidopyrimidine-DNA glycosylase n=1 Tax=Mycoplasmopsis californica TaxID=2113 RepID=A0A059XLX4_9BACT|nr:DNA-formamidopyrimidine glycosylase [Mycoplasmopsis californica]AIA29534.1 formamidopyrimidine-DNA glycosylase [Mycoplasmopsis californica]